MAPMTKAPETLPNFLRAWRKRKKMTQERLAELAGYTPGAISQFETGVANFTVPSLVSLANILGCRPGDILSYPPDEIDAKTEADAENRLRLAMLAFGIHHEDLIPAMRAISGFVEHDDEQSLSDQPHAQSGRASRHHAKEPS